MTKTCESSFSAPGFYRIEVQGRLRKDWSDRLGAMQVSSYVPDGDVEVTVLQGPIQDQPELAGIIKTLYELHLTLRSVRYLGKVPAAI
ncbi:MAG: hypothetical protein WBM58_08005 [Sedimenticolaceae bacterium]